MPIKNKKTTPKIIKVVSNEVSGILYKLYNYDERIDDLQSDYSEVQRNIISCETDLKGAIREAKELTDEARRNLNGSKNELESVINNIIKARQEISSLAEKLTKAMLNIDKVPKKKKKRTKKAIITEPVHELDTLESRQF